MQSRAWLRAQINGVLLGQQELTLKSDAFPLAPHFQNIDSCGLYLHIPFCRQICPYCPYNKELFRAAIAERYADAVLHEIDHYAAIVGNRPIISFYIGGTPTTMLGAGLPRVLERIYRTFNMQCGIAICAHLAGRTPLPKRRRLSRGQSAQGSNVSMWI